MIKHLMTFICLFQITYDKDFGDISLLDSDELPSWQALSFYVPPSPSEKQEHTLTFSVDPCNVINSLTDYISRSECPSVIFYSRFLLLAEFSVRSPPSSQLMGELGPRELVLNDILDCRALFEFGPRLPSAILSDAADFLVAVGRGQA